MVLYCGKQNRQLQTNHSGDGRWYIHTNANYLSANLDMNRKESHLLHSNWWMTSMHYMNWSRIEYFTPTLGIWYAPFNVGIYIDTDLQRMVAADYLEHTTHKILSHELKDPGITHNPKSNLRFTVAFEDDTKGHPGHPGLRWRDLQYVPAFRQYMEANLPELVHMLPRNEESPKL